MRTMAKKKKSDKVRLNCKVYLACDKGTKLIWRYSKEPEWCEDAECFSPSVDEDAGEWFFVGEHVSRFLLGRVLEEGEMAEVDIISKAVITNKIN